MRQKIILNSTSTDRELFVNLPTGDIWPEAEVVQVWTYLYNNRHLKVPDSWQRTLADFHQTVMDAVLAPDGLLYDVVSYCMIINSLKLV